MNQELIELLAALENIYLNLCINSSKSAALFIVAPP